jgi:hypothetical protein
VVGSDEMGPNSTLDQLRRANVKVEVMATAPTLANLNERIDTLAHLLDQAAGSKLKEEIAAQSDTLAAQAKQNKPLKVAFLLLHRVSPPASLAATPPPAPSSPWRAASIRWLGSTTTSPFPPNPSSSCNLIWCW